MSYERVGYLDLRAFLERDGFGTCRGWGLGRVGTSSSTKGHLRAIPIQFTVLIEGGIGPQPHPNFIEVFGDAPVG